MVGVGAGEGDGGFEPAATVVVGTVGLGDPTDVEPLVVESRNVDPPDFESLVVTTLVDEPPVGFAVE